MTRFRPVDRATSSRPASVSQAPSAEGGRPDMASGPTTGSSTWKLQSAGALAKVADGFEPTGVRRSARASEVPVVSDAARPLEVPTYDPGNYLLGTLGLPSATGSTRTSTDMLRAFKHQDAYKPDPARLRLPAWLAPIAQAVLLGLNRISSPLLAALDRAGARLVVRWLERADSNAMHPFGRMEEINKGARSTQSPAQRYPGVVAQGRQTRWFENVHGAAVEIARRLGFGDDQGQRIATAGIGVDFDETHYRDPYDPAKPRITRAGSGGKKGDLHRHFNRAGKGEEDTRITAAKTHLDRSIQLAGQGYYDAAERELGIGLHSIQDMFSHAQITPITHGILADYPDMVSHNTDAARESLEATQAYLTQYAERLGLWG